MFSDRYRDVLYGLGIDPAAADALTPKCYSINMVISKHAHRNRLATEMAATASRLRRQLGSPERCRVLAAVVLIKQQVPGPVGPSVLWWYACETLSLAFVHVMRNLRKLKRLPASVCVVALVWLGGKRQWMTAATFDPLENAPISFLAALRAPLSVPFNVSELLPVAIRDAVKMHMKTVDRLYAEG